MKTIRVIVLGIICTSSAYGEPQEVSGRSFMFTRPASAHLFMRYTAWHNLLNSKRGPCKSAAQGMPLYQESLSARKTARYFLINCKNELAVIGDATEIPAELRMSRDVRAEWVGLPDTFQGKMNICPAQQQAGLYLEYLQDLSAWCDNRYIRGIWVSIVLPLLYVKNNLQLRESITTPRDDQTITPRTIKQAFNQQSWNYGKLSSCAQSKTLPAELRLSIGRPLVSRDCFQIGYYFFLAIPTGNKATGRYLFEPIVGNNAHVNMGGGVHFQLPLNKDTERICWAFFADLEGGFQCRNKQWRTFDLCDKPWSRFLTFRAQGDIVDQTFPGVNILTRRTVVRPYGLFDFATGFRAMRCGLEFELGYGVWGHAGEVLALDCPSENSCCAPLCGTPVGIAGTAAGTSASNSTIAQRAADDTTFVAIKDSQIDLHSAAAGSTINHTFHAALAMHHLECPTARALGIGIFAEWPQKNGALQLWGVWAKMAATF